ncbi:methyl-accepting chemotaxis protein [Salinibaculum salinum]|uniref:methyl-accepting chemotaxis protein n=1 Tax=Salinibaculum salinum TaxID=3131996 RepID=UPI0030EE4913
MSGDESETEEPNVAIRALQTVTPRTVRKSFAVKFGLVLMIMAISIGGIGLAATDTISQQTEDRTEQQFENSAAQQANTVEEWVQNKRLMTQLYSTERDWSGSDTAGLTTSLTSIETEREEIVAMHLIDNETEGPSVTASTALQSGERLTTNGPRGFFETDQNRLDSLDASGVYLSDTYEVDGEQVVGFVSKTNTGLDQTRYLFVEVSIDEVRSSLGSTGPQTSEVVDESSYMVMVSDDPSQTLQPYSTNDESREPIQRATALRDTNNASGVIPQMDADPEVIDEAYTVGYAPVEGTDWVVVTQAPRSSVFGFVQAISNWGLFATIGAVLLIGITGTALGYSTSTAIDRLTRKTERMREGDLETTFYTSRIDNIGRLYDGFAEMRDSLKEQINEAERARKEAEVSRAEALEMSNYLQEKAEEYSEIMQECAAGDLTQRMSQDGENESMDRIASEFNDMIEELEKTTGQLKSYVDEVETAGAEVEQSATTVRKASEQVAESIQKIAVDAEDQKERLQTISETMDDIAGELERFADQHPETDLGDELDSIQDIAGEINEIAELSEETQSETDNVSAAAEEQAAELNEVSERANDLQRYAQPLRDILDRFETEAEHEFVFSVGPTGSANQAMDED